MRVGLDLLFLVPGETGGRETYARELVRGLVAERPDLELTALVNRETRPATGSGARRRAWCGWTPPASRAARGRSGELRAAAAGARAGSTSCTRSRTSGRLARRAAARVLTVHDVLWRRLPDAVPTAMRLGDERARRPAPRGARDAGHHRLARLGRATSHRELKIAERRRRPQRRRRRRPPDRAAARRRRPGRPPGRAQRRLRPPAQEPRRADRRRSRELAERPLLAFAGHGTDTGALRARGRRARRRRRRAAARRRRPATARGALRRRRGGRHRRRASRASACPCSRRWRAACRSRAPSCRCCARWPATRRSTSTRRIRGRLPTRYERRSLKGTAFGLPASTRAAEFSWAAAARATAEVYERATALAQPSRERVAVALPYRLHRSARPEDERGVGEVRGEDGRRGARRCQPVRAAHAAHTPPTCSEPRSTSSRSSSPRRSRPTPDARRARPGRTRTRSPRPGSAATSRRPRRRRTGPRRAAPRARSRRARPPSAPRPRAACAPRPRTRSRPRGRGREGGRSSRCAASPAGPPTARARRGTAACPPARRRADAAPQRPAGRRAAPARPRRRC